MGKKKKMTPAQAAAARRDDKPRRRRDADVHIDDSGPKDRTNRLVLIVTIALVGAVAVFTLVFSLGATGS